MRVTTARRDHLSTNPRPAAAATPPRGAGAAGAVSASTHLYPAHVGAGPTALALQLHLDGGFHGHPRVRDDAVEGVTAIDPRRHRRELPPEGDAVGEFRRLQARGPSSGGIGVGVPPACLGSSCVINIFEVHAARG